MYKLSIKGVELPDIWIVTKSAEIKTCQAEGLPYIIWFGKEKKLIKLVLYPLLKQKFPGIKWDKVLDLKTDSGERPVVNRDELEAQLESLEECDAEAAELLSSMLEDEDAVESLTHQDICVPGGDEDATYSASYDDKVKLADYISGKAGIVHLDELAFLHVLPSFMEDISTNIKLNLETYNWVEGYNKKRGATIGSYDPVADNKNLIILDVSGSIPDGISATMLALADTMRNIANADFILTGSTSYFYEAGTELPSPKKMRAMCGYSNESEMFTQILLDHVDGNTYDNVIVFGDGDSPCHNYDYNQAMKQMNVTVHEVYHYHTYSKDHPCGYGKWVDALTNATPHYNTDWCDCMDKTYCC